METSLTDPSLWHRIHFGFTITYHYLFPQLTMGLAWFLVSSRVKKEVVRQEEV
jgi:cytochrome bd-type quinol oxidase subunit 1